MIHEIKIKKEDIKPLIYFIITMFQQDNTHRQGTSSKSDLIGGFIDRWINKIPEDIIFNKSLLLEKSYSVVNDYFIYGSKSEKNAPDILGLKEKEGDKLVKFAEYDGNKWMQIDGKPHIEIKTFRKRQNLISVRDTQLDDDNYYMFIESNIDLDYLINLFDISIFNDEVLEKIKMSNLFIKENPQDIILQPQKIILDETDNIGTLKILRVIKGVDYRKRSTLCHSGENVYYLKDIEKANRVTAANCNSYFKDVFKYNKETKMYSATWQDTKMIDIYAENIEGLKILKKNKKSFYCETDKECSIYNFKLDANTLYKVELEIFERSSKWNEYVALKNQFSVSLDKTQELIELFDKLYNSIK